MDNQTRRSYSTPAIAIVIAAIIIGAAILDSSTLHTTVTSTSTATSTTTSIATETQTQTTTLTQAVTSTATTTRTSTATAMTTMISISTTTSTFTSTDYPFVAPQLQVQVNATTIRPGGSLMASISLLNVLPYNLSVIPGAPSNSSIADWNEYDFFCGGGEGWSPIWSLAGYAVFEGHYSPANISSAGSPLTIRAPLDIECPVSADPDKIVFLPDSSRLVAYFASTPFQNASQVTAEAAMNATTMTCALLPAGYVSCDASMSLFGYWNSTTPPYGNAQDANATSPYFHYFSPGQYTLAVDDMWGETTYVYFQVVTANPPST